MFKIIVTQSTPCGNLVSFPISNPNQFIQQLAAMLFLIKLVVKILLVLANHKNIFISDGMPQIIHDLLLLKLELIKRILGLSLLHWHNIENNRLKIW